VKRSLIIFVIILAVVVLSVVIVLKSGALKDTALLLRLGEIIGTSLTDSSAQDDIGSIEEDNGSLSGEDLNENTLTWEDIPPINEQEQSVSLKQTGWIPDWAYSAGYTTLASNTEHFDSISPVFYELQSGGSIKKYDSHIQDLLSFARSKGIEVIPSIASFSADDLHEVIEEDEKLNSHIEYLISEVDQYQYDGIDIDYEEIYLNDQPEYLYFLSLLKTELNSRGKKLSIAVMPNWTYSSIHTTGRQTRKAQEWHELGLRADEFRIMTYNVTNFNSTYPGPIGPIDWQEANLRFAVSTVDKEKIFLGINQYGYAGWGENIINISPYLSVSNNPVASKGLAEAFTYTQVTKRLPGKIELHVDPYSVENVMRYSYLGKEYMLFFPDKTTTEARYELASKYGIAGVAHWRLGDEENGTYDLVENYR
jgi:spore germination protein YaaH